MFSQPVLSNCYAELEGLLLDTKTLNIAGLSLEAFLLKKYSVIRSDMINLQK